MTRAAAWMERWQVPLYLAALAAGAALGLLLPAAAGPAETAITPALALLLYATFLAVPFASIGRAVRDWRFLAVVLLVNFVFAPLVVLVLTRVFALDRAVLAGVLLVLLTPCVDYVIVFTGIAGGARDRLLAATPLLMLLQMVLLPVYLRGIAGPRLFGDVAFDPRPFVEALVLLIALPLVAAGATQWAAGRARWARGLRRWAGDAMVPLMMLVLAAVVTSQIAGVGGRFVALLPAVPVYLLFAAVMAVLGATAARLGGLDVRARRAVVFSGVTRNSLVVLPLALALPAAFDLAPLAVVTQTLVELLVMVLLVALLPRLIPARRPTADARG